MDISYLLYLQNLREATSHIFDKFFTYVTNYGEMAYLLPLFAIIYWCINKKTIQRIHKNICLCLPPLDKRPENTPHKQWYENCYWLFVSKRSHH